MLLRDVSLISLSLVSVVSRGRAVQKQIAQHLDYYFLLTNTKPHPFKARLLVAMKQK